MKHRSFQARLALWVSAISGVMLFFFGLVGWLVLKDQFLQSVDLRLADPLERLARRFVVPSQWGEYLGDEVGSQQQEATKPARALTVLSYSNEILFESELLERFPDHDFSQHQPSLNEVEGLLQIAIYGDPFAEVERRAQIFLHERGETGLGLDGMNQRPGRHEEGLGSRPPPLRPTLPLRSFTLLDSNGERWRIVAISCVEYTIFGGARLSDFDRELNRIRNWMIGFIPLALLAIGGSGMLLSKRALRPLIRVSQTASQMTIQGLGQRISVSGQDYAEFAQLAVVLNGMMERLDVSFHQATRFTADASHELKTPIAIIQAEVDAALKRSTPDSKEHQVFFNVSEEIQRLKRIIQSLLLLSQADSGQIELFTEEVDFSAECEALVEDLEVLCESACLNATSEIQEGILIKVDKVLFMQSVQNLLSNAIKYNYKHGRVVFRLYRDGEDVYLRLSNTGTLIPTGERANVFKRFYRLDAARNRATDGFGLGLNLAREIVRAHGGDLRLCDDADGLISFEIQLKAL